MSDGRRGDAPLSLPPPLRHSPQTEPLLTSPAYRLYNVLDYNEPYVRAPRPSQLRATAPPPSSNPGSSSTSNNNNDDDDDDDDNDNNPIVREFLTALLQIQGATATAQEKARREALVRQRLAEQEQAKREAVARLYLQAAAEMIQEAAAEEERERQETFLLLMRSLGLQ